MEFDPKDCIYIGDSPSDGKAAAACSMKSIGVSWGSHSIETITPHFDIITTSVSQLRQEVDNFINGIWT